MVIVGITANVDADAVAFYFTAMNALDYPYYSYEQLIEGLLAEGAAEEFGNFAFEFDEPYTFFGVAEDEDGNFTEMWSSKEITFKKSGCSPASEFFTSVASAGVLEKSNAEPATASVLSVEQ